MLFGVREFSCYFVVCACFKINILKNVDQELPSVWILSKSIIVFGQALLNVDADVSSNAEYCSTGQILCFRTLCMRVEY